MDTPYAKTPKDEASWLVGAARDALQRTEELGDDPETLIQILQARAARRRDREAANAVMNPRSRTTDGHQGRAGPGPRGRRAAAGRAGRGHGLADAGRHDRRQ